MVVIRLLLVPLFVKQIRAQRNLQAIQPQLKAIQAKHAGDRERQSQEMMKLYKDSGTNPLSSCMPILLQMPIFFALYNVLQQGISQKRPIGVFGGRSTRTSWPRRTTPRSSACRSTAPSRTPHRRPSRRPPGCSPIVLIILMSVTSFITQRQLLLKNTASDNPVAQQMKIMMYVFPFMFAFGGLNFPIGVLMYWFTTNVWTMGQQFYVIRNNPQPGTPAAEALAARRAHKAARKGLPAPEAPTPPTGGGRVIPGEVAPDDGQTRPRTQPKRQPRSKRSGPPKSR